MIGWPDEPDMTFASLPRPVSLPPLSPPACPHATKNDREVAVAGAHGIALDLDFLGEDAFSMAGFEDFDFGMEFPVAATCALSF